ncbi:hypothetical protein Esti_005561 [Eimeria stiedai]
MARLPGSAHAAGGAAGNGYESLSQEFWLDHKAFIVFGRQVETPVVRSGKVMLLLDAYQSPAIEKKREVPFGSEQQWLKRYCEVRGNFLFYGAHSDAAFEGAFLLEDLSFKLFTPSRAVIRGFIPRLPSADADNGGVKDGTVLVGMSRHDGAYGKAIKPLVMLFDSTKAAASWKETLETCNASLLQLQLQELQNQLERERAAADRERKTTALIAKQQQLALDETEGSKRALLLQIERLEQRNQRLQASGEVTEKAAAEFADQKVHEVSFLQNELATQLAGSKRLEQQIVELRDVLSTSQQKVHSLTAENSQLNCKVADFLKDLEDARDNPSRFTLLMSRLRSANQKAAIENKRLRQGEHTLYCIICHTLRFTEENRSLTQNFHQLEEKFRQKALLIRQIAERGDVFDLMRKWLICSERKIRFYEQGYIWSPQQEEEELEKIEELQRAIRVAEAAARSSYISHRAFLLGEQLKACTINASQADVYSFLRASLDRFGWIFGEVEPYQPKGDDGQAITFWRDVGDAMAPIPLREQIYPFGGKFR